MNFIYISPEFPKSNWMFCERLKRNGVVVLGIGQENYENLNQTLREALTEYYRVNSLENYDEMLRAVAFFTFKYGKIDWLESNNEYWLEKDAQLRTDFNISSGFRNHEIKAVKSKSLMKDYFARAGVPSARYQTVTTLEAGLDFAKKVGYPLIVKPDIGVGASNTFRLDSDEDLQRWYDRREQDSYLLEEYLEGEVVTYDAVVNSKGVSIYEASIECPVSIMTMVNDGVDCIFFSDPEVIPAVKPLGLALVKEFHIRCRFVHLEFFRLTEDRPGLAKKGDYLALEVNMRPAGGFTPDMYNYAGSVDVFQIWADMIVFDRRRVELEIDGPNHYCVSASRRDCYEYVNSHEDIVNKYGKRLLFNTRLPDVEARLMGNSIYLANVDKREELSDFVHFVTDKKNKN